MSFDFYRCLVVKYLKTIFLQFKLKRKKENKEK